MFLLLDHLHISIGISTAASRTILGWDYFNVDAIVFWEWEQPTIFSTIVGYPFNRRLAFLA